MHVNDELGERSSSNANQAGDVVQPASNEAPRTRKITVQLSENILELLQAATDRPGLGKNMVVETALERFFNPVPPTEGLVQEVLDRVSGQIARLEREIAIIAETWLCMRAIT
ncbi:transcriptional regulator of met regulon [Bradyrhizobium japonicum]